MIADHSDNMGFFPDLNAGNESLLADPKGREWYDKIQQGVFDVANEQNGCARNALYVVLRLLFDRESRQD